MSAAWRLLEVSEAESQTVVSLGRIASRIKAMAENIHAGMGARQARRRMRRALSHLDDHMLRDIGVSRADLGHAAGDLRGIADVLTLLTVLRPH